MPVVVDKDTHDWLVDNPGAVVSIDLDSKKLQLPDGRGISFPLDGFSRYCLMEGIDQLGYLMQQAESISQFEAQRPWKP